MMLYGRSMCKIHSLYGCWQNGPSLSKTRLFFLKTKTVIDLLKIYFLHALSIVCNANKIRSSSAEFECTRWNGQISSNLTAWSSGLMCFLFCNWCKLNLHMFYKIPFSHSCTLPSPFLSAFTWLHLINIPLMFTLSVKSHLPAEGFPLCKQSLLCVWNQRGQHSTAQASNKDPDSCRNNPGPHWECKTIRCSREGASLKVDNQCLCEAKRMPTGWAQSSPSVLLSDQCGWFAFLWITPS